LEELGGSISLLYSDRHGTEFKFYLPLCTAEDDFDAIVDLDKAKELFFDEF
jgi:hypothetical protein